MTRVEQIAKLRLIDICIANITYTYDTGLMFDVIGDVMMKYKDNYKLLP